MVSVTLKVTNEFKMLINGLPWINWSELAREEVTKRLQEEKTVDLFKKIVKQSTFTEKDAEQLAEKVKVAMHKNLKKKGLV